MRRRPHGYSALALGDALEASDDAREQSGSKKVMMPAKQGTEAMNGVIYLIGLVVVVLALLSFLGLH